MVIVRLMGGLGNQMFQYAAGRRLAKVIGVPLKLDTGWFDNISDVDTPRRYELGVFNIREDFATTKEVEILCGKGFQKKLRHFRISAWLGNNTHLRENTYSSILEHPSALRGLYLDGYWQSEKYFTDIADIIRSEFTIKSDQDIFNRGLAVRIGSTDAVSVHVRRGDYISNPRTAEFHETCSIEYYQAAMKMMAKHLQKPIFYVFSDDPCWAAENLQFEHQMEFLNHNGPDKGYEDLRLISYCRHHIIANSSFSWWGAWLCPNPEKVVVAPRKWFRDNEISTDDLLPKKWIRL